MRPAMHLSDRGCDGEEIRSYGLLVVARILEGLAAEDGHDHAENLPPGTNNVSAARELQWLPTSHESPWGQLSSGQLNSRLI